jgi:hypothetical protein
MAQTDDYFVAGFKRRALWYGSGEWTMTLFKGSGVLANLA